MKQRQTVKAIAGPQIAAGGVSAPPALPPTHHHEQSRTGFWAFSGVVMPKRPRRNKRLDAPHVRLYRWMLDSPAYLSLTCPARAVLIEIARGHDGTNNGRLGLSIRRASERCNIARGTAQRAFVELQERGFIDCMTKGAFSRKALHATEWRLTWWGCDVTGELPSKKFMSWGREKQNAVSKYPVAVSNQIHRAA
jgi:hypothetical protein